jgi:hypothetical protein
MADYTESGGGGSSSGGSGGSSGGGSGGSGGSQSGGSSGGGGNWPGDVSAWPEPTNVEEGGGATSNTELYGDVGQNPPTDPNYEPPE